MLKIINYKFPILLNLTIFAILYTKRQRLPYRKPFHFIEKTRNSVNLNFEFFYGLFNL